MKDLMEIIEWNYTQYISHSSNKELTYSNALLLISPLSIQIFEKVLPLVHKKGPGAVIRH